MADVPEIQIRKARPADLETLVSFNAAMAKETENRSLDPDQLTKGTKAVFESLDKGFYLVAEADGRIVGTLLITFEWSDWRNGTFWWIQSVYVRPGWRRWGIYRTMHEWVYNAARSSPDVCGIRLYVHRANEPAQMTYASLGMAVTQYDLLESDFVLSG